MYSSWTTDIHRALDIAARSQKVALKTQDPDDMARAESMLGAANHSAGNHLVEQRHFEAGLRHSASGSRPLDTICFISVCDLGVGLGASGQYE